MPLPISMFCEKCQIILNVDVLLSTHPEYKSNAGQVKPIQHHDSLVSLAKSAKHGCVLCQLAMRLMKGGTSSRRNGSWVTDSRIYWTMLRDDLLSFRSDEELENWSIGHDGIKLYSLAGFEPIQMFSDAFRLTLTYTIDDPIIKLLSGAFVSRPLARDARSEECFAMAKTWIQTCLESHGPRCASRSSTLPKRVVDVGISNSQNVSLHISNGELGEWLTLSHCWGKNQIPLTTKSNMLSRIDAFSLTGLPRSFRDAIFITRKLGYRYIWIDCLCIIQDSDEDWQRESVKMAEIYANAVLTISADAAADSNQGIFKSAGRKRPNLLIRSHRRQEKFAQLPVHSLSGTVSTTIFASPYNGRVHRPQLNVLEERAWAFQEAVLSRRRLRFTCDGILWSCSAVYRSCGEVEPHRINDTEIEQGSMSSIYNIPIEHLPARWTRGSLPEYGHQVITSWYTQVNQYATRKLTHFKDRFPAISGLVEEFSNRTGYHYVAGIWVEDFRRGLLWRSLGGETDTRYSPTWSWAATVNVQYGTQRLYFFGSTCWNHVASKEVELVDTCVENVGGNPFGQVVLPAQLSLRGICRNVKDILRSCGSWTQNGLHVHCYSRKGELLPLKKRGAATIVLWMDSGKAAHRILSLEDDIIVLQVARFEVLGDLVELPNWRMEEPLRLKDVSFGLVLEPVPDKRSSYRRIGMAEMEEDGTEELGWDWRNITII